MSVRIDADRLDRLGIKTIQEGVDLMARAGLAVEERKDGAALVDDVGRGTVATGTILEMFMEGVAVAREMKQA